MIIGQPKSLDDIPPFSAEEMQQIGAPLVDMIAQGAPPNMQAAIEFGGLCRMVATSLHLYKKIAELEAKVKTLETPLPTLRLPTAEAE